MNSGMDVLRDFEAFLSKLGTVPEDKIKFYIHWVRRFLKFCNYSLDHTKGININVRSKEIS